MCLPCADSRWERLRQLSPARALPQANYGHPLARRIKYPAASLPPSLPPQSPPAPSQAVVHTHVCVRTCLFSQAGCSGNRKSRLWCFYSQGFSLSLSPSPLHHFVSPLLFTYLFSDISSAEGSADETWHSRLLLHLVTVCDSCTYFWSAACF